LDTIKKALTPWMWRETIARLGGKDAREHPVGIERARFIEGKGFRATRKPTQN
jgi:hypothetical protein